MMSSRRHTTCATALVPILVCALSYSSDGQLLSDHQLSHVRGGSGTNKTDGTKENCDDYNLVGGEITSTACEALPKAPPPPAPCVVCTAFGGPGNVTYKVNNINGTTRLTAKYQWPCGNGNKETGNCQINPATNKPHCFMENGNTGGACAGGSLMVYEKQGAIGTDPDPPG